MGKLLFEDKIYIMIENQEYQFNHFMKRNKLLIVYH